MTQEIALLKTIILVLVCCLSLNCLLAIAKYVQDRKEAIRIKQAVSKFGPIQALIRKSL